MLQSLTHSQLRAAQRMFELTLDEIKGGNLFQSTFCRGETEHSKRGSNVPFQPVNIERCTQAIGGCIHKTTRGCGC